MRNVPLLLSSLYLFACTPTVDNEDSGVDIDPDVDAECESQPVAHPVETKTADVSDGSAFIYTKEENAKGLIVFFHGGGGSKEDNLHLRIDAVLIAREAQKRGYALAALDSVKHLQENPPNKQWSKVMNIDPDRGPVNPDVVNAIEMIQRLRAPNDLAAAPADAPVVVLGFSNGGSMASRLAQFMPVAASVTYISNSVEYHEADAVRPPMVLVPGSNDFDHQASESNAELAELIEGEGGAVLLINNPPEPVSKGLFQRVPGIDCDLSMEIRQALQDGEWLQSDGTLSRNPKSDRSWSTRLPDGAVPFEASISDVLWEAYAEHVPSSDWNTEVFEFLDEHID